MKSKNNGEYLKKSIKGTKNKKSRSPIRRKPKKSFTISPDKSYFRIKNQKKNSSRDLKKIKIHNTSINKNKRRVPRKNLLMQIEETLKKDRKSSNRLMKITKNKSDFTMFNARRNKKNSRRAGRAKDFSFNHATYDTKSKKRIQRKNVIFDKCKKK